MAKSRYIFNRSNYTIREKHQNVKSGTVYERDFMTTTSPGSWSSDSFSYGDGNFKFTSRSSVDGMRKRRYGGWVKSPNENDYWVLDDISGTTEASDSKIIIKPNFTDMSDFAYYNSLMEKVLNTTKKVANFFPAEMYATSEIVSFYSQREGKDITIDGNYILSQISQPSAEIIEKLKDHPVYLFRNDYGISATLGAAPDNCINKMRYLSESANEYTLTRGQSTQDIDSGYEIIYHSPSRCEGELVGVSHLPYLMEAEYNNIMLFEIVVRGQRLLFLSKSDLDDADGIVKIRPKQKHVDAFFNGLDDFEAMLLNRESTPIYTCSLYTPVETDEGVFANIAEYTWPTLNGYNIDLFSVEYSNYLSDITSIAEFYDKVNTNVLWGRMVHDSIKNMDRTYENETNGDDNEDYALGTAKMEKLAYIMGAFFDKMKSYADNIRTVNTVTYDGNANTPDYFLSDTNELSGWDISDAANLGYSEGTEVTLSGKTWDKNSANVEFMKNLKLNSGSILSKKGTKDGIESLLGLFGFTSYDFARLYEGTDTPEKYDYRIREYVQVANGMEGSVGAVERYNSMKYVNAGTDEDSLNGLPLRKVTYFPDGFDKPVEYLIPWFYSPDEIDGEPYFQLYGGWGKMDEKKISNNPAIEGEHVITSGTCPYIYDESLNYIGVVKDIVALSDVSYEKLNGNDIYYVYDISGYEEYYGTEASGASHYFFLKDKENSDLYGYDDETEQEGWVNVPESDIMNLVPGTAGTTVVYRESIVDQSSGNDPHVGYGNYDDGEEYIEYFRKFFKYSIDNDNFSNDAYTCESGEIESGITTCGFIMEKEEDNQKSWFFSDETAYGDKREVVVDNGGTMEQEQGFPTVGYESEWSTYKSQLSPHNNEGDSLSDEAAAFSVVNTKVFEIVWHGAHCTSDEFKEYFYKSINPYLKQVLPSTIIYKVVFG